MRTADDSAPSKRPHQEGTSHKRHSALTPLNTQIAGRAQDLNICTHQTPPPPKQQQQQQQQQQHRHTCTSNTRCCVRPYVSLVLGCEVNVRPARDNTPRSLSLSSTNASTHGSSRCGTHDAPHLDEDRVRRYEHEVGELVEDRRVRAVAHVHEEVHAVPVRRKQEKCAPNCTRTARRQQNTPTCSAGGASLSTPLSPSRHDCARQHAPTRAPLDTRRIAPAPRKNTMTWKVFCSVHSLLW
jgi:hypothetical protein